MLTCCPNCKTSFRITPEQLKARKGKVRCGECQHVFNALDTLIDDPTPIRTAPPTTAFDHYDSQGAGMEARFPEAPWRPPGKAVEAPAKNISFDEVSVLDATPDTLVVEPVQPDPPSSTEPDDESIVVPPVASVIPAAGFRTGPTFRESPDTRLEPEVHEEEPSVPRRWPWIIASVLAVLALVIQLTLHFRVELAVLLPESRPALEALCGSIGCTVDLPRNVELVSIESSDLHPDPVREKLLTLTATLKNRAPFAQSWPYLELTLTDTSDRPLARRILSPADYLPKNTDITAGFGPRREIVASVSFVSEGLAANGYRLYLFYP